MAHAEFRRDLILFPQSKYQFRFGYSRNDQDGPALSTVQLFNSPRADEFPLFENIRRQQDEYRVGAEATFLGMKLSVLRGWEVFKDDTVDQVNQFQPGNNLTDPVTLTSFQRSQPYHGTTDNWQVHLLTDKSRFYSVTGRFAYGLASTEKGVHRLVRISPYDAAKRRHTSFASVDVVPEITDDEVPEIDPKELRIDTYRSQGAGGQHVNVTDSAVRITHLPTGVQVAVQNERSQLQNRAVAMKILAARLAQRAQEERLKELQELRGEQMEIGFGSQIRSYVLAPYQLVKDHRTDVEEGNVEAVLDGEIDQFITAELRRRASRGSSVTGR